MNHRIDQLFTQLDTWRKFPAYALERRADIYFALYMKEIFNYKFGKDLEMVLPEFPVRIGSIDENALVPNLSKKIDFVGICQSTNEVFLIELKTDMRSRRESQDEYLLKAQELNIPGLVDGILLIYKATKQKTKYNYLIEELILLGWIKKESKPFINISTPYKVSIIYIQPINEKEDVDVVTFDDIIEVLKTKEDEFSKRFAESLDKWKKNPNLKSKTNFRNV
jgi:hypothetical protein